MLLISHENSWLLLNLKLLTPQLKIAYENNGYFLLFRVQELTVSLYHQDSG